LPIFGGLLFDSFSYLDEKVSFCQVIGNSETVERESRKDEKKQRKADKKRNLGHEISIKSGD